MGGSGFGGMNSITVVDICGKIWVIRWGMNYGCWVPLYDKGKCVCVCVFVCVCVCKGVG